MAKTLFPRFFLTIFYIVALAIISCQSEQCEDGDCINPDGIRVISMEELSTKTGKDEGDVWISVLGQVFDVTSGRDFYGEGASYSIFAGRDASPCFASGTFNEEAAMADMEELKEGDMKGIDHWRKFYVDDDKYLFVGLLEGLYYQKDGQPTSKLSRIQERLSSIETKK
uniref:Cytochrome b5 heme-binding domain-containing protein n=1 Tax=Eucampia antarctica TaxID=49252 RepID=A0A7S2WHL1_9STRA|mmetsp:Transcript_30553/g.29459  ORF Transcript_30553/g.29459 Transcript_30553/m.29459 type:complete len:169 (+) Transcript_30553:76-582(+)